METIDLKFTICNIPKDMLDKFWNHIVTSGVRKSGEVIYPSNDIKISIIDLWKLIGRDQAAELMGTITAIHSTQSATSNKN